MSGQTLYLGLNAPRDREGIVHFPVIRIVPRSAQDPFIMKMVERWDAYTHLVCTSRSAVCCLRSICEVYGCEHDRLIGIAVGKATASEMSVNGFPVEFIAGKEQAEGVVEVLDSMDLGDAHVLWPHSALSRSVLCDYFSEQKIQHDDVVIYDTVAVNVEKSDAPDLDQFTKIVFTSPSTVDAFFAIYGTLDVAAELVAIGPITQEAIFKKTC